MVETLKKRPTEYPEKQIPIFFKWGLPGLDGCKNFTLHVIEDNPYFYYLQSLENEAIGLILIDPFSCFSGYVLELGDLVKRDLKILKKEDVLVLSTVTVLGKKQMTVNLAAPIVINIREKIAKQIIISDNLAQMRMPLPVSKA
ncbi:MAG: flagellar assembly protein FliW [Dethiobacteria bacterium]|jgi:flagellar assembly factor FliW